MTKQKGFAHTVLIVALIGALGFIFWQNFIHKEPAVTSKTTTSSQPATTEKTNPNEGYVVLGEWGIRFETDSDLSDTQVTYAARNDVTNGKYYALSTSRVEQLGEKCTEQPFGSIVTLTRFNEKPIATPDGQMVNDEAIEGYYYVVSSPIAPCSSDDVEVSDRRLLIESLKSLESAE